MGLGGTGAGYSLHEFTRGPLRAESHEVIHTDNSPRVPVPTQGTCGAKRQVTQTTPSLGHALVPLWQSEPCPDHCVGNREPEQGFKCWLRLSFIGDTGQDTQPLKY